MFDSDSDTDSCDSLSSPCPSPLPQTGSQTAAPDQAALLRQRYQDELSKVDGIEIDALPLMPYMIQGVKVTVPVMLRVKVGDFATKIKRDPVHVCLVLDRSGSMSGKPLANCKAAIKSVIAQLHPSDLISLVMYDDNAETVFSCKSNTEQQALEYLVDNIRTAGCTNISGGIEQGVQSLKKAEAPKHQRAIFLFSDGEANRGITNLDELGEVLNKYVKTDNVQITSFGVGTSFNEEWMRTIARAGKGNYFFIKDIHSMEEVVQRGVSGFTSVVSKDAVLRIRALNGHTLNDIQTLTTPEVLMQGYKLHTLRSLGMYTVMANIELNPNPEMQISQDPELAGFEVVGGPPRSFNKISDILEYELVHTPVDPSLGLQNMPGKVHLTYTTDNDKLQERQPDVLCHVTMLECETSDKAVEDALVAKDRTGAISRKKEVLQKLQEVLPLDKYGVIASMVARAENMIRLLEKEGTSEAAQKYQGYTTGWNKKAKKCRKKCDWEDNLSEDDEDMQMGLFD